MGSNYFTTDATGMIWIIRLEVVVESPFFLVKQTPTNQIMLNHTLHPWDTMLISQRNRWVPPHDSDNYMFSFYGFLISDFAGLLNKSYRFPIVAQL